MQGDPLDDLADVPDPADDFEGCLEALTAKAIAEADRMDAEGFSDAQRNAYYLDSALKHLARMRELNAPDCIIEQAEQVVARREKRRDELARAGQGQGGTDAQ